MMMQSNVKQFLVQRMIDGELYSSIMAPRELINYIDMDDCHGELYEIYDVSSTFGEVKKLHYVGWQPNCLIEIADENGNIVLRGYGTDH